MVFFLPSPSSLHTSHIPFSCHLNFPHLCEYYWNILIVPNVYSVKKILQVTNRPQHKKSVQFVCSFKRPDLNIFFCHLKLENNQNQNMFSIFQESDLKSYCSSGKMILRSEVLTTHTHTHFVNIKSLRFGFRFHTPIKKAKAIINHLRGGALCGHNSTEIGQTHKNTHTKLIAKRKYTVKWHTYASKWIPEINR